MLDLTGFTKVYFLTAKVDNSTRSSGARTFSKKQIMFVILNTFFE